MQHAVLLISSCPQDIKLLNESRKKLEGIIDEICRSKKKHKPGMYREKAAKNCLSISKSRQKTYKKIRAAFRKQLGLCNKRYRIYISLCNEWRKTDSKTEFGAKLQISMTEVYAGYLQRIPADKLCRNRGTAYRSCRIRAHFEESTICECETGISLPAMNLNRRFKDLLCFISKMRGTRFLGLCFEAGYFAWSAEPPLHKYNFYIDYIIILFNFNIADYSRLFCINSIS